MGDTSTKPAKKAAAPKKERKIRTIEEQIADAEAKAEALRKRAADKQGKARKSALEKRAKLVTKRDDVVKQIEAIDAEFPPSESAESDPDAAREVVES